MRPGKVAYSKVAADGSESVTPVFAGAPFRDPSGVAISAKGEVYACDTVADEQAALGSLIAIKGGNATIMSNGVRAGFPCGVALTADESTLLVSALDPVKKTDVVILFDLASNGISYFSEGIDTFVESAGLHRAKQGGNTFAWADSVAGGSGTVFRVILP